MSSRKVALANKARGRAFQSKLAELTRGVNLGTLGGEDVGHVEFSYEAKTYNIRAKSNKNKPWMGEVFLTKVDQGYSRKRFGLVEVASFNFDSLVLLRWYWWNKIIGDGFKKEYIYMTKNYMKRATTIEMVNAFIGNTYMNQSEKNCPDAKLPVVVVHTTGRRHENDIVIVRVVYWESLLNKILDK